MQNMGEHILLDLYACLEDRISTAEALTDNAIKAFSHVCECEETPSCTTFDEEIVLTVVTAQCHMILHAYPALGYVAADLYTYKKTLRTKQFIKDLPVLLERSALSPLASGEAISGPNGT